MTPSNPEYDFNADEFQTLPDSQASDETEAETPERSFLSHFIGEQGFIFVEQDLQGAEKAQGVTLDRSAKTENEILIFDRETIDGKEKEFLVDFQRRIKANGKEALRGTKFEWMFEQADEEFLAILSEYVDQRLDELAEGLSQSSLHSMGINERLVTALEVFRQMAKRSELKEAFTAQVKQVPIHHFEARLKPGQSAPAGNKVDANGIVQLRFNFNDMNDPTNEVEALYVNSGSGEKELIFSCKSPIYETMRPVLDTEDSPDYAQKFNYGTEAFTNIPEVADPKTGDDFSRYELTVAPKSGQITPLFNRVKVLKKPIDLNAKIDQFTQEQKAKQLAKEMAELEKEAKKAQQYQSKPPSASSSRDNWNSPPPSYSRSG